MKEKNEIFELNWLRGIAAIFVILYHYTFRYYELFESKITQVCQFEWGSAGVNTFFVLSGFLIVYTMKNQETPQNFLFRRLKRLYPTYWFCMAVSIFLLRILLNKKFELLVIIINGTMLQDFLGVESIDGAYWTLSYELRFYAIIFLCIVLTRSQSKENRLVVINVVAILILVSTLFYSNSNLLHSTNLSVSLYNMFFMPKFSCSFIAGMLVYFIIKRQYTVLNCMALIGCVMEAYIMQESSYVISLLLTICYIAVVMELRKQSSIGYNMNITTLEKNGMRLLSQIARISFPLYLLHQNIGYGILQRLEMIDISNQCIIIVPIVCVILLAVLIYKVESIVVNCIIDYIYRIRGKKR